jgi:hypothetical protein
MHKFNRGDIFKCLNVWDDGRPDYFTILHVRDDSYSILWVDPQITGAINFTDISEKNGKVIIFKTNEIQLLSEYESLVLKLKYAQNW